jgi:hypothetical protein
MSFLTHRSSLRCQTGAAARLVKRARWAAAAKIRARRVGSRIGNGIGIR